MLDMTNEEYDKLDDFYTNTVPSEIGADGTGYYSRQMGPSLGLDSLSYDYVVTLAQSQKKPMDEVLNELIHNQIARAA
jgi:hypothetical protein